MLLSDTHNNHPPIDGDYDVICHLGDATNDGTESEMKSFSAWFNKSRARHKIFVPGNHDVEWAKSKNEWLSSEIIVLKDELLRIDGITFYGSPAVKPLSSNHLNEWSFCYSDEARRDFFSTIPLDLDFLLTHSPPYGIFDFDYKYKNIGCEILLNNVLEKKPRYHVFGHCHSFGGYEIAFKDTKMINVATKIKEIKID